MLKAALILTTASSKESSAYSTMPLNPLQPSAALPLPPCSDVFPVVEFELFFIAGGCVLSVGPSVTGLFSD